MPQRFVLLFPRMQALLHPGQESVGLPHALQSCWGILHISSEGSASWQVMPQRSVLLFPQIQALLHPGQESVDLPHALQSCWGILHILQQPRELMNWDSPQSV